MKHQRTNTEVMQYRRFLESYTLADPQYTFRSGRLEFESTRIPWRERGERERERERERRAQTRRNFSSSHFFNKGWVGKVRSCFLCNSHSHTCSLSLSLFRSLSARSEASSSLHRWCNAYISISHSHCPRDREMEENGRYSRFFFSDVDFFNDFFSDPQRGTSSEMLKLSFSTVKKRVRTLHSVKWKEKYTKKNFALIRSGSTVSGHVIGRLITVGPASWQGRRMIYRGLAW